MGLLWHSHPLQGGQVEHSAAADVIIVVPAPVEIVVRELVTSEGERGLRHQAQAVPNPRADLREAWRKLGPPPPTWARHPHHPLLHQLAFAIGPASTEPRAPLKGHAHSKRPRPHPVHRPASSRPPHPKSITPPLRQTQRSSEGPRHLHRIPRLSEAPWEVP